MAAAGFTITVDTGGLMNRLASLRANEIPTAARNVLNDVARAVAQREKEEIRRVFDRPTPLIQNSPRVPKEGLATKLALSSYVWLKDTLSAGKPTVFDNEDSGDPIYRTLTPHIPGYPAERMPKGMERWLRLRGWMTENEWLIPTKSFPLNQYGNVPGGTAQRILSLLGAYGTRSGFAAPPTAKNRYKYKFVRWYTSGSVEHRGIWTLKAGIRGRAYSLDKLIMVVVKKTPKYSKRFRFHGVARLYAERIIPQYARLAIDHAIRRRN